MVKRVKLFSCVLLDFITLIYPSILGLSPKYNLKCGQQCKSTEKSFDKDEIFDILPFIF